MRSGADLRTQVCAFCRRGDKRESDMVPVARVDPKRVRGWVCVPCADRRAGMVGYRGKYRPGGG